MLCAAVQLGMANHFFWPNFSLFLGRAPRGGGSLLNAVTLVGCEDSFHEPIIWFRNLENSYISTFVVFKELRGACDMVLGGTRCGFARYTQCAGPVVPIKAAARYNGRPVSFRVPRVVLAWERMLGSLNRAHCVQLTPTR